MREGLPGVAQGEDQPQELGLRPDVHVDRVVLRFQLLRHRLDLLLFPLLAGALGRLVFEDEARPLAEVFAAGALRPLLVVGDHVLDRGDLAAEVEGEALVRDRVEEDAAGLQFREMGLDRADRILGVLEEVVGDDEILALGADRGQLLAVVDDVDLGQAVLGELRVLAPQVRRRHPVQVVDVCLRGGGERLVEGADLDPLTAQVAVGEGRPRVEVHGDRRKDCRLGPGGVGGAHHLQATGPIRRAKRWREVQGLRL